MNGSILDDTKKLLGVSDTDINFDKDIIIGINTSFSTLYQLGAGDDTSKPFSISDSSSKWSDFMSEGLTENIKTYIYLNTRLLFDPPTNSFLVDSIRKNIDELTWRINIRGEELDK